MKDIKLFKEFSESLSYHLVNSMPITENVFRSGSKQFFAILEEARNLFDEGILELKGIDKELYESTEIGNFGTFNGQRVPLDIPMEVEEEIDENDKNSTKENVISAGLDRLKEILESLKTEGGQTPPINN
jgi:hypothetical protein